MNSSSMEPGTHLSSCQICANGARMVSAIEEYARQMISEQDHAEVISFRIDDNGNIVYEANYYPEQ